MWNQSIMLHSSGVCRRTSSSFLRSLEVAHLVVDVDVDVDISA